MLRRNIIFLTVALLSACTGTKRFTHFIEPKLVELTSDSVPQISGIVISVNDTNHEQVKCTRERSLLVPAIIYWQWNNTMKYDMNQQSVTTIFSGQLMRHADSMGLAGRLNGAQLQINIDTIPSGFRYVHRGFVLFLVVAYVMKDVETIFPVSSNLVFHYTLTQNGVVAKEGQITIRNKDTSIKNRLMSRKRFTWQYLDQYKYNLNQLSKQAVQGLLSDIE